MLNKDKKTLVAVRSHRWCLEPFSGRAGRSAGGGCGDGLGLVCVTVFMSAPGCVARALACPRGLATSLV